MAALSVHASRGFGSAALPRRFSTASTDGATHWLMKRNCSIAPRQLLFVYLSLSTLALTIGVFFWLRGAPFVLPFAGLELLALGGALAIYSRHAADRESVVLGAGRLRVDCHLGGHVEHAEFAPARVRVEPEHRDGSLIELSGEGRRIAIGRFVRPELRRALADELRAALRRS